jgi:hypothetical protein
VASAVAGIVDARGGLRIVVTQRWRLRHHTRRDEQLFVVPGFEVEEPVPWEKIPFVIETVQKHVVSTLAPVNHCGDCTACCVIPHIRDKDFEKPSGVACPNCSKGFGCRVYQQRPSVCRTFKCMWLESQSKNDRMPAELRPNRCGAFFVIPDDKSLTVEVHGKPNSAAWVWLNEMQAKGYKAKKITSYVGESFTP